MLPGVQHRCFPTALIHIVLPCCSSCVPSTICTSITCHKPAHHAIPREAPLAIPLATGATLRSKLTIVHRDPVHVPCLTSKVWLQLDAEAPVGVGFSLRLRGWGFGVVMIFFVFCLGRLYCSSIGALAERLAAAPWARLAETLADVLGICACLSVCVSVQACTRSDTRQLVSSTHYSSIPRMLSSRMLNWPT